jgi:predicted AAA+ superfamily ATPase
MEAGRDLFSRHAERMTAEALADTRVVVVNGARQVGKSTLAELIVARSASWMPSSGSTVASGCRHVP